MRRAEKSADDRAETADDDDEQNLEREIDVESLGFRRAEPKEDHQRSGDAA